MHTLTQDIRDVISLEITYLNLSLFTLERESLVVI
jgi:hypothetical protein